jgi:hypothetical protein
LKKFLTPATQNFKQAMPGSANIGIDPSKKVLVLANSEMQMQHPLSLTKRIYGLRET